MCNLSQCDRCQSSFATSDKRKYHRRDCNPLAAISLPQGKGALTKDADGMYHCQCHPGCSKKFDKVDSLKKHIQRSALSNKSTSTSVKPEEGEPSSTGARAKVCIAGILRNATENSLVQNQKIAVKPVIHHGASSSTKSDSIVCCKDMIHLFENNKFEQMSGSDSVRSSPTPPPVSPTSDPMEESFEINQPNLTLGDEEDPEVSIYAL
jgi:hypothetical protein